MLDRIKKKNLKKNVKQDFSHSHNVFSGAFFTWCYYLSSHGVIPYRDLYLKSLGHLIQPCHDQQEEVTPQFCKSSSSKYLPYISHFRSSYVGIALEKLN